MVKKELIDILVCPKCSKEVYLTNDGKYIECTTCKLLYKIENDIPIMLIDNAIKKNDDLNQ